MPAKAMIRPEALPRQPTAIVRGEARNRRSALKGKETRSDSRR